jgi:hypothetical protein
MAGRSLQETVTANFKEHWKNTAVFHARSAKFLGMVYQPFAKIKGIYFEEFKWKFLLTFEGREYKQDDYTELCKALQAVATKRGNDVAEMTNSQYRAPCKQTGWGQVLQLHGGRHQYLRDVMVQFNEDPEGFSTRCRFNKVWKQQKHLKRKRTPSRKDRRPVEGVQAANKRHKQHPVGDAVPLPLLPGGPGSFLASPNPVMSRVPGSLGTLILHSPITKFVSSTSSTGNLGGFVNSSPPLCFDQPGILGPIPLTSPRFSSFTGGLRYNSTPGSAPGGFGNSSLPLCFDQPGPIPLTNPRFSSSTGGLRCNSTPGSLPHTNAAPGGFVNSSPPLCFDQPGSLGPIPLTSPKFSNSTPGSLGMYPNFNAAQRGFESWRFPIPSLTFSIYSSLFFLFLSLTSCCFSGC